MVQIRATRNQTFIFDKGSDVSRPISVAGFPFGSIQYPSVMTSTTMTVQVSNDGINFQSCPNYSANSNLGKQAAIDVSPNEVFILWSEIANFQFVRLKGDEPELESRELTGFISG